MSKMKEMAVKKTIAIIGEIQGKEKILLQLVKNYRLLWITKEEDPYFDLSQSLIRELPEAELEIFACAKEGCWEADIIFLEVHGIEMELIEKIREVATQKIVVVLGMADDSVPAIVNKLLLVQEGFPYSKIVEVYQEPEIVVVGKDPVAVEYVKEIVQNLELSYEIEP